MDAQGRRPWILRNGGIVLGIVLFVVGVVLAISAPAATGGWFAYQPQAGAVFVPSLPVSLQFLLGYALVLVGMLCVTAVVSYRIGKRRRS